MRTRRVRDVSTKEKNHRAIVNSCNKQTSRLRYVMTKYLQSADTQEGKPINARGRHVMPRSACPADFFNFRAATDLVSEWRSLDRHLLARQAAANYNDCECVYCLHGRRDGSEKYRRLAGGSRVLMNSSNFYLGLGERARFSVSAGCKIPQHHFSCSIER